MWFKRYVQKCTLSHVLILIDITDLVNHGMVKNAITWISREENITCLWNKKILDLCLEWYIYFILIVLRYYSQIVHRSKTYLKDLTENKWSYFSEISRCVTGRSKGGHWNSYKKFKQERTGSTPVPWRICCS